MAENEPQVEALTAEEEKDLEIAVNLAENLIDDGGIDVINQAMNSKDPGQIIGQFLFQLVSQMGEQLSGKVDLSPRIFFAYDGWIEQVSDYLQEEYDIPKDVMDRAEMYIGTMAEQTAQQQAAAEQGAAAPQQPTGPVLPQQGGMV